MPVVEPKPRRWILWSAAAFGGFLAILVVAFVCLYFFFPGEWLSRKISRDFEQSYHWKLALPPISPFPLGRFTLGEVALQDPEGKPFLTIKRVEIGYRLLPLLRGIVDVEPFVVEEPTLFLRKENGEWNVLRLYKTVQPVPPPPGPLLKVDYLNTRFNKLWPEIKKALDETMRGVPALRLSRASINRFRLMVDDGAGNVLDFPPITVTGDFTLTSSERRCEIRTYIEKDSPFRLNNRAFRVELEKTFVWPGSTAATARSRFRLSDAGGEKIFAVESEMTLDLSAGNFSLRVNDFSAPGYVSSHGLFGFEGFGAGSFHAAGELRTTPKAFSPLWSSFLANQFSLRKLPEISADLDMKGRILAPSVGELARSLSTLRLPMQIDLRSKLQAKNLARPLLSPGTSVREIDGALMLSADEASLALDSSLRASKVSLPNLGAFDLVGRGRVSVKGLRSISVPFFSLQVPTFGFKAEVKGVISSTLPFPELATIWQTKKSRIRDLRKAVSVDLNASVAVDAAKVPKTLKGLSLAGMIRGALTVTKKTDDRMDVAIEGRGENFSASTLDGLAVQNLSFHFPFRKTVFLGPGAADRGRIPDASLWAKTYSAHLYPLSPYTNTLRATRISAAGFEADNLVLDAGFDGSNLVVDRFAADVLGGSLWGRMTLLSAGDALKLSAATEVVNLDVSKLTREKFEGDALVSLDAQTDLTLVPGRSLSPEGLLDDLGLQFHLTKVGDQALDRLITFLDPKGENPSMVQARGLLHNKSVVSALRNPRVSFSVAHGMMDADIVLPGVKLVDLTIPIRGISVKNLLKFSGFRQSLAKLAPALEATKYLRFTGIDDEGKFVFARSAP